MKSLLIALLLLQAGSGCASDPPRPDPAQPAHDDPQPDSGDDPILEALVAAHNHERAEAGLPPLAHNAALQQAAENHARDMAQHGAMSHKGSDGSTAEKR